MTVLPDVVEEHAEEASFLYDQRAYLTRTLQAGWRRLEPIESRIEQHLDALLISGSAGVRSVWERVLIEPGAAFAAAVLAARTDRPEDLSALWGATPTQAGRDALVHGLAHEPRPSWASLWTSSLAGGGPLPAWVAAHVVGRGLLPLGSVLLDHVDRDEDPRTTTAFVEALGRLRYGPALSVLLHRYLPHSDPGVSQAALTALALSGVPRAAAVCAERAADGGDPAVLLAASGGPSAGRVLAAATRRGAPRAALALGLHGDPAYLSLVEDAASSGDPGAELGLSLLRERVAQIASRSAGAPTISDKAPRPPSSGGSPSGALDVARVFAGDGVPVEVRRSIGLEHALRHGTQVADPNAFVFRQRESLLGVPGG